MTAAPSITRGLRLASGAALTAALFGAGPAAAHHGFGNFDTKSEVTLKGTITKLEFVNPHSYVYFDAAGADGAKAPFRCEMRSATVLRRSGWTPELFKPGEPITITGAPDRFDPHSCYVNTILFADGTTADRYAQLKKPGAAAPKQTADRPARLPTGEPNLNGDWAPEQLVMTDPKGKSGALVPVSKAGSYKPGEGTLGGGNRQRVTFTPEGQKRADAFRNGSPEDNPRMRCATTSILFDWTFDGPVDRITQTHDTVTLQYGQLGLTRTVHLDQQAHPADVERTRAGHSIGHWDGDVLVVDTVGFLPGVLSPPIMNSEQLHVVERFELDPATMKITRSYTAEDPVYYTDQYQGSDTIGVADLAYAPDKCEELTDHSHNAAPPAAANAAGAPAGANGAAAPSSAPAAPATSWWKFWEWFN
jgi:hypothetical protein